MGSYEKLYLAKNLEALELLAIRDFKFKNLKFKQLCDSLPKLLKTSQVHILDQEKTYILLYRYLLLYNHLKNTQHDQHFVELMYGTECKKVSMKLEEIKKSLMERYAQLQNSEPVEPIIEKEMTNVDNAPQRVFQDEFITCLQLYSALQKRQNILLVDARPESDFAESRIEYQHCINVPDHCIGFGLSANALGKKLPPESQAVWDRRDSFDSIVLFDWKTESNSENFSLSKLPKLRSALVDWDLNRNYREPPVILKGGYLELLQTYPSICTNPRVYLSQKDNELDELLELDNIEYPTESDSKNLVMGAPEKKSFEEIQDEMEETYRAVRKKNNQLVAEHDKVLKVISEEEDMKLNLIIRCANEKNINNIAEMRAQISEISAKLEGLEKTRDDLNRQRDELNRSLMYPPVPMETDSENKEDPMSLIEVAAENLRRIIEEEKERELQKARASKPTQKETGMEESEGNRVENVNIHDNILLPPKRPTINRSTKPIFRPVPPLNNMGSGLIGLKNIRNTCYMNTIIQCIRNIPAIAQLFCLGEYARYNIRNPAAIINELSDLIRLLWSLQQSEATFVNPHDFYVKVGKLDATYRLGNHEDCMEFFLFLLNHLSEDCTYMSTVRNLKVLTPRQKAWYNQFKGKNSVFMDYFYHQIRITQFCVPCNRKTIKFEIEGTFMLPVPEHDFNLEDLMADYMDDYIISDYLCAGCKKPVNNKKELCYEPKIVVIDLKRYKQFKDKDGISVRKIDARVSFRERNFRLGESLYHLNAIAMHRGTMNHGHYTAAALTKQGWFEFNDENVRPININDDAVKTNAYAFFYSTCDIKE